jgi:hypothetical protein
MVPTVLDDLPDHFLVASSCDPTLEHLGADGNAAAPFVFHADCHQEEIAMTDPTENMRRALVSKINSEATERADLESRYGQVWNTQELARDFEVMEFAAPFAIVKRKADNRMGSVLFQHHPRYYFSFQEDR